MVIREGVREEKGALGRKRLVVPAYTFRVLVSRREDPRRRSGGTTTGERMGKSAWPS